jgi:hypothetical protein
MKGCLLCQSFAHDINEIWLIKIIDELDYFLLHLNGSGFYKLSRHFDMSIKYTDIIKQFDGDEDSSEWIRKLELVGKPQNVKDMEKFLPLFLSGGVFSVNEGLDDKVKQSYNLIKASLTKSFAFNPFRAYEEFAARRHRLYESVDVYLSDLRKLANLIDSNEEIFHSHETVCVCVCVLGE